MSELIFPCPATGRSFNSGFHATIAELKSIPHDKVLKLRCSICGDTHQCRFAEAGLCDTPNHCRHRKDCQCCPFAIHCA